MKRMAILSLLALSVILASEQRASAWCRFKFGIGLNISYEGSGNTFLWGLCKGGPNPNLSPDGVPPVDGGYPAPYPAYSPGIVPDGYGGAPPASQTLPPPTPVAPAVAQPVSYNPYQANGYYPYGYPQSSNSGDSGQAPSYWYNNR
jgi:hypothetical protein